MIDAHQHFWQLSRGDYAWPNADVSPIFKDFGPKDLQPLLARAGVDHTILVQATDSLAETEWLLDCAQHFPTVAGVVGWVDLSADDAVETIKRLHTNPRLKGLRPMLQSIAQTDWILRPEVQPALEYMARVGLCFDALIQPRHLPVILDLSLAHPDLAIVIDHIAKPRMGEAIAPDADWRAQMTALADRPNVFCKLSGMVTEIGPEWQPQHLAAFGQYVLESFGPARVMWGSDWPVLNIASDYQTWLETAQSLAQSYTQAAREQIFDKTARHFYKIGPAPECGA